ncbi:TipAS antibiotic-recognition domain-containing protein [Dactylosporangium roseum]|uniref:TipAS antibiotic-recognition domain-containing protein n=1 Tax=Dactylosporangium roseum TaxID=47989 RepID=A0ABY5Z7W8_9ACTN|nr:TipAS antibiotic-recognition domain-containing protein [Dactylosporangium roseum]UWZ38126.1 TipAS antibiotic-recognition domain-containing protein [Dactylosporangium roseum]
MTTNLTPDEQRELFGDFDPDQHAEEAERRWGQTEAYRQSAQRTSNYTKQDWERIKAEAEANTEALAAAFTAGVPAGDQRATDLAEEHRRHISRWFYDCSYEIHRGLGDMYVADPRFTANYDTAHPGLAQYIRDAIHANADRVRS